VLLGYTIIWRSSSLLSSCFVPSFFQFLKKIHSWKGGFVIQGTQIWGVGLRIGELLRGKGGAQGAKSLPCTPKNFRVLGHIHIGT